MTDGRTDGRTDKAATICSPFGEHKNGYILEIPGGGGCLDPPTHPLDPPMNSVYVCTLDLPLHKDVFIILCTRGPSELGSCITYVYIMLYTAASSVHTTCCLKPRPVI